VVVSAFLQAFTLIVFIRPADLLSSGFTGLAILLDRITSLLGISFPTFVGMITLNIPVAILCWRHISRRFVLFSMAQVFLAAFFLRVLPPDVLTGLVSFESKFLDVVFGGFLYGFSIALALKGGASTAGSDFISLMVSNRTGKTIWGQIFAGNCVMLLVFGAMFTHPCRTPSVGCAYERTVRSRQRPDPWNQWGGGAHPPAGAGDLQGSR